MFIVQSANSINSSVAFGAWHGRPALGITRKMRVLHSCFAQDSVSRMQVTDGEGIH